MDRWVGKVAVVTGASAGIGAATCEKLVHEGLKVVGLARRVERVKDLAKSLLGKNKGKLYAVKCDITKQEDVENAFKWVRENVGPVQILVNNAGLFKIGTIMENDPSITKTILDTNVLGLCMCTREAFKHMKDMKLEGHIFHVNSIAGHQIVVGHPPIMNIYSPSKYAVTALTEVMREEVTSFSTDVRITSISPGLVDTEIGDVAGVDLVKMLGVALKSEDIADAILYALSLPLRIHIQELTIRPFGENAAKLISKSD